MSFYFLNLFATCGSVRKASPKNFSKLQNLTVAEKNLMSRLETLIEVQKQKSSVN